MMRMMNVLFSSFVFVTLFSFALSAVFPTTALVDLKVSFDGTHVIATTTTLFYRFEVSSQLWSSPTGLPSASCRIALSQTGQYMYAACNANGIYQSNDYGVTFSKLTTLTATFSSMACSHDGSTFYAVGKISTSYYLYRGASYAYVGEASQTTTNAYSIVCNDDCSTALYFYSTSYYYTLNSGTSFASKTTSPELVDYSLSTTGTLLYGLQYVFVDDDYYYYNIYKGVVDNTGAITNTLVTLTGISSFYFNIGCDSTCSKIYLATNRGLYIATTNNNVATQWTYSTSFISLDLIGVSGDGSVIATGYSANNDANGKVYISLDSGATWFKGGNGGTAAPSLQPSFQPTLLPTIAPTFIPTLNPTLNPTLVPTIAPTFIPTLLPTLNPSLNPTLNPTLTPTLLPTTLPSSRPSSEPTKKETGTPSSQPTSLPSDKPSSIPTSHPSQPTSIPTTHPSTQPTSFPSRKPSSKPTSQPSSDPTSLPTKKPSSRPSASPTNRPSAEPSVKPSSVPTSTPSSYPSSKPSVKPSGRPSSQPTVQPTAIPTKVPSTHPTSHPSSQPTTRPTSRPTLLPTSKPTVKETGLPTSLPSSQPTSQPTRIHKNKINSILGLAIGIPVGAVVVFPVLLYFIYYCCFIAVCFRKNESTVHDNKVHVEA